MFVTQVSNLYLSTVVEIHQARNIKIYWVLLNRILKLFNQVYTKKNKSVFHECRALLDNSCGHTTDFYQGKTDLPRANSSIGRTELTPFLGGISLRWGGIN